MSSNDVLTIFKKTNALLEGHFVLTSGLHSPEYFQCAKVLQFPVYSETLCAEIGSKFTNDNIQTVIAPAVGGILVGYEVARQLGARSIFAERENSKMALRRGFRIYEGDRVVICEDVTTTGGSVMEIVELVRVANATLVGIGCLVDRSGGAFKPETRFVSCLQMNMVTFKPESCPLCKEGSPAVKPGSRALSPKTA
jgi:orotate phosphoribosyltransferase